MIAGLRREDAQVEIYDPLVQAVTIGDDLHISIDGLESVSDYDLVVVTCRHDEIDAAALADAELVLDATYSLPDARNRFVP